MNFLDVRSCCIVFIIFCFGGLLLPGVFSLLGEQHPFLQACARGTLVEVSRNSCGKVGMDWLFGLHGFPSRLAEPARPESHPVRPEGRPAWPEAQPVRLES